MTASMTFYDGRITIDPSICNGKPTLRGKRITAQTILEFLGAGNSEVEILEQYPSLEPRRHQSVSALRRSFDGNTIQPFSGRLTCVAFSLTRICPTVLIYGMAKAMNTCRSR